MREMVLYLSLGVKRENWFFTSLYPSRKIEIVLSLSLPPSIPLSLRIKKILKYNTLLARILGGGESFGSPKRTILI